MLSKEPKPTEQNSEGQHPALQAAEHIVGVGLGAAAGGAVGAVIGVVGGPAGVAAGAVSGAVAGGLAGEALAELVDEGFDERHWQEHFQERGYAPADYESYRAAYQAGWLARRRCGGKSFDEVEGELRRQWDSRQENSRLSWECIKQSVRDAWDAAAPTQSPTAQSPSPRYRQQREGDAHRA